jgi:hypothetical protein
MGVSKLGEGCPIQGRAACAAQGYLERAFPPELDDSIDFCVRPPGAPSVFAVTSAYTVAEVGVMAKMVGAAPFCGA